MSSLLGTFKTLPPELQATFRAAVLAQPSIIKTIAAIGITEEEILEHVIELIKQGNIDLVYDGNHIRLVIRSATI
jgi:hypothetical protein